ncbi:diaminopimelate epimerase [Methermicoccus shengliensis]|uniref:Diaminopimelate epimerase n=1 Tax=Methermicoccus shengliensis TaxID=660064 RepID=A0A832RUG9_9EURY|nr:diaminopimelate epimerase [Methermicoccus shengliensis]KUK04081.1 MAG: Diaminopimelate epimerase [Euryarchaeota archaeon 55_53]KUK29811.1 MAG: Diaminopimelate epimerase [Methanosarcinales archeaon 56_1174]MDI3488399.1 diaminopimelate epimerase [Methanosarcinales archaeon]MDN5295037.1 diaminopimelate epimerase [Methanosarcinales archaeon]HIH69060.1 diaminopimelate epimerase [Methermicoccus shengliensis]
MFEGVCFEKVHGNGNDFVVIDEMERSVVPEEQKPQFASIYCDRRMGIGADGILFIQPSSMAHFRMRLFQQDGSEAEMCGNGLRCAVLCAYEHGYISGESCAVETGAGIRHVSFREHDGEFLVRVNMGTPEFSCERVPVLFSKREMLDELLEGERVCALNTGVPHAVVFVENLDFDIERRARPIRWSSAFPEGTNVNFALVEGSTLRVRTFERGVEAETLSCGTGSVACAAAARRTGRVHSDEIRVITKGGTLTVSFEPDGVYMEGPARRVFSGMI